jgi:hypothetical protein
MRTALCITLLLALLGCTEDKAPDGFKAVIPQQWDTSRTGCPDLIGSYLLGSVMQENALLAGWSGHASKDMTFFIFDSLVGSNAYNLRIQAEPQYFLTAAKKLQQAQSDKYYQWRKLISKAVKENRESDRDLLREISELGPVFRFKAQVHGYACSNGWMKILEAERKIEQDLDSYISQQDLWVGRDPLGNLLLRTDIFRQKPGWTFWAAGGAGMRLINEGRHWHKMQKAPDNLQPRDWVDSDLPAGTPTHASGDCTKNVATLVDFNQQLLAQLPDGVFLEKFNPVENIPTAPCSQQRFIITISATSGAIAEEFLKRIRTISSVVALELIETRADQHRVRLLFEVQVN